MTLGANHRAEKFMKQFWSDSGFGLASVKVSDL